MKKLLIALVRFYRRAISLFPGCCRYIPTCPSMPFRRWRSTAR